MRTPRILLAVSVVAAGLFGVLVAGTLVGAESGRGDVGDAAGGGRVAQTTRLSDESPSPDSGKGARHDPGTRTTGGRSHPPIRWRDSVAIGPPEAGRLVRGVRFPGAGGHFFTWDPILKRSPNRKWRRWGTDVLVRTTLRVLREFRRAHPKAPRIGMGDLSLPEGGYFGPEVSGGIGHATHQNGLDVDIYYPRLDRRERPADRAEQVNLRLAQDLVDRFVAAGAVRVYVGPNTPLEGPAEVVEAIPYHDNHLHARLAP